MFAKPIRALRWWIIGLVMLGTIINYLTRSTLSVAAPTLTTELNLTTQQYSYITGLFQLGIMMQPIAGYFLDIIKLKWGFAIFATAWGLITMAHGLANSWQGLAALRGLLGFAEGIAHPGGLKVVAEWFPAKERGLAGGIYNIGASFGSMLAPPLVVWAILYYNWRMAFVITGVFALIWVVLWIFCYQSPEKHKALSETEKTYIKEGQESFLAGSAEKPSPMKILRQRNFWGIALPRFLADPTWGTLTFWMPLYLATSRGFDLTQIALFAWLPFVAADIGCLFGPAVVLWLQKRGVSLINARRWTFTLGAILMTGMIFVGMVDSPYVAIGLLCLGAFAHQTLSVTVITMSTDLFRKHEVGTVTGMAGTFANLGVLLFSLAIGALVTTVGYEPFFIVLGVLDLIAAAVLWTLVKAPAPEAEVKP
ncbi:MFS transporter [Asticcacaulis endophyticus]|uniref:Hexuronate transporter n=1 Tax=Asticcacaulis endophyticus TaxID=1395890 RepID=A0A918UVJ9_9CAUL|nr:MFS transporter [Asticcacaulis endophyticus]GGZ35927.1 hexuronate transporter [Asticcacaulis endophyticus]